MKPVSRKPPYAENCLTRHRRFAALLLACLAPLTGSASHVAIRVNASASFREGQVSVQLTVTNRGDKAAHNLEAEAFLNGRTVRSGPLGTLDASTAREADLPLGSAPARAGTHTIVLRLRYTDDAGRPFSVLTCIPLLTADPDPPNEWLALALSPSRVSPNADFFVQATNRGPQSVTSDIRLWFPDEFDAPDALREIRLEAASATSLVFRADNRTALPGSRYALLVVADYQALDQHRSTVAAAMLLVPPPRPLASPLARATLAAIALLLLAYVRRQF